LLRGVQVSTTLLLFRHKQGAEESLDLGQF